MENTTYRSSAQICFSKSSLPIGLFYAVYDCSSAQGSPSWDLAFIEERFNDQPVQIGSDTDEMYFDSLRDAKDYVKIHYQSGGEYFSLQQSEHPDNFIYILTDKIRYLIC